MEGTPTLQEDEGEPQPSHGLFSCWACLKRAFPWRRLRRRGSERWRLLRSASRTRRPRPGNFRYDPLSYSQNFEENAWDKDDDNSYRGFSSRFVVITPATAANPAPEEQ